MVSVLGFFIVALYFVTVLGETLKENLGFLEVGVKPYISDLTEEEVFPGSSFKASIHVALIDKEV